MGEQVAARFLFRRKGLAGVAQESRMYLENCTQSQSKIDDII